MNDQTPHNGELVMQPTIDGTCPSGPLKIEVWKSGDEIPRAVLRVKVNGRGRLWIMLNSKEWVKLKQLVDEGLKGE